MSNRIADFLIEIAEDPRQLDAFKENPRQKMAESGLSEEEQDLLLSGDVRAINEAVSAEDLGGRIVALVFVVVQHD